MKPIGVFFNTLAMDCQQFIILFFHRMTFPDILNLNVLVDNVEKSNNIEEQTTTVLTEKKTNNDSNDDDDGNFISFIYL